MLPTPPDSLSGREESQKDKTSEQASIFCALSRLDPAKSLLLNPIQFIPATHLTYDDQMARLRGQKAVANVSTEHNRRRNAVLDLPNHLIFRRDHFRVSKPKPNSKPVGFRNPLNWCYRRSVNQSLMNIPKFGAYLQNHQQLSEPDNGPNLHSACRVIDTQDAEMQPHKQSEPEEGKGSSGKCSDPCLICSFSALFKACESRDSQNADVAIKHLDRALRMTGEHPCFKTNNQEDAHEYLLGVIDHIFENYNHISPIIEGLFKVQSRQTWQCQSCSAENGSSYVDETGLTVCLDRAGRPAALETLLSREFTSQAEIRCESCKESANRIRTRKITAAPEALFIQLSRFTFDPNFNSTKLMNKVDIPETLDLSQYLDQPQLQKLGNLTYKLSSVVHHSGSLKAGHYIATISVPNDDGRGSAVWEMNDRVASKTASGDHTTSRYQTFTPYILTYINTETRLRTTEGTVDRESNLASNLKPLK